MAFVIQKIFVKNDGSDITEDVSDINALGYVLRREKEKFSGFVAVSGTIQQSMFVLDMVWESREEWERYLAYVSELPFYVEWWNSMNQLLADRGITQETIYLDR
jgi:hypothetical protein